MIILPLLSLVRGEATASFFAKLYLLQPFQKHLAHLRQVKNNYACFFQINSDANRLRQLTYKLLGTTHNTQLTNGKEFS